MFHLKLSRFKAGRGKFCSRSCRVSGVMSTRRKLSFQQVCAIRLAYRRQVRGARVVALLAVEYGVHPGTIYRITSGVAWAL